MRPRSIRTQLTLCRFHKKRILKSKHESAIQFIHGLAREGLGRHEIAIVTAAHSGKNANLPGRVRSQKHGEKRAKSGLSHTCPGHCMTGPQ